MPYPTEAAPVDAIDSVMPAKKPLRDMVLELRLRQRRLGTTNETHTDFEETLALAHTVNNALTALCLTEALQPRPVRLATKEKRSELLRRVLRKAIA